MSLNLRIAIIIFGIGFMIYVVRLLLKKNIEERNAIFWMTGAFFLAIFAIFPWVLDLIAKLIGVGYPPALLFLVSTIIMFSIMMHQSIQISILTKHIKELAQISAIQYDEITDKSKHINIELDKKNQLWFLRGVTHGWR